MLKLPLVWMAELGKPEPGAKTTLCGEVPFQAKLTRVPGATVTLPGEKALSSTWMVTESLSVLPEHAGSGATATAMAMAPERNRIRICPTIFRRGAGM